MRLQEKRAARRYWHTIRPHGHCGSWHCFGCHWKHSIGEFDRRRRRHIYRANVVSLSAPKVYWRRDTDGVYRRTEES